MGISAVLHAIATFYAFPFTKWQQWAAQERQYQVAFSTGHKAALIAVGTGIYIGTIGMIYWPIHWLYRRCYWYAKRKRCQHCEQWTLDPGDDKYPKCVTSQACCHGCYMHHRAEAEPDVYCPTDGFKMKKVINGDVIYARCPRCRCSFLDEDAMAALHR